MINLKFKQAGNFSVEFAIVGIFFSLLLVFSGDVIIKLSVKGKLDRLSFSLVNVVKERTQLYDADYNLKVNQARDIKNIAENSLKRTLGTFDHKNLGVLIEELTFSDIDKPNKLFEFNSKDHQCVVADAKKLDRLANLSVVTSWGRQASLYRVTLCYETDNWAGELLGKQFTTVSSSSVMIGR